MILMSEQKPEQNSERQILIAQLAAVHPNDLKQLVSEAEQHRLAAARAAIPSGEVETIQQLFNRKKKGQTFSKNITLQLCATIKVTSVYEFGDISDCSIALIDGTPEEKGLWNLLSYYSMPHNDELFPVFPEAIKAIDEESEVHKRFERALESITNKYAINGRYLIKED